MSKPSGHELSLVYQLKNMEKIEKQLDKDFAKLCDCLLIRNSYYLIYSFYSTSDMRLGDPENYNWHQVLTFDSVVKGLEIKILASDLKFESTNIFLTKNY